MIKKFLNLLMKVSTAAVLTLFLFVIGAKSPEWHTSFLRRKVGSVVIKIVTDNKAISGGTGFHVVAPSGKTYILTNAHVCKLETKNSTSALVAVPNSQRFVQRRILEISDQHDLCLVEALEEMSGVTMAEDARIGDYIRSVGHPLLRPLRVSLGKVLGSTDIDLPIDVFIKDKRCMELGGTNITNPSLGFKVCYKSFSAVETDIVIFPGSSGSPVVNFWGNLVGVVFASDTITHYGFLVPLKEVKEFLKIH